MQSVLPRDQKLAYCGFLAGSFTSLACCVNIPFDVAKSRTQVPQPSGHSGQQDKYTKTYLANCCSSLQRRRANELYIHLIVKIVSNVIFAGCLLWNLASYPGAQRGGARDTRLQA